MRDRTVTTGAPEAEILTAAYDAAHPTELRFCEVVWGTVRESIKDAVGADAFTSWIAPIKIQELARVTVTLWVPMRVHARASAVPWFPYGSFCGRLKGVG